MKGFSLFRAAFLQHVSGRETSWLLRSCFWTEMEPENSSEKSPLDTTGQNYKQIEFVLFESNSSAFGLEQNRTSWINNCWTVSDVSVPSSPDNCFHCNSCPHRNIFFPKQSFYLLFLKVTIFRNVLIHMKTPKIIQNAAGKIDA